MEAILLSSNLILFQRDILLALPTRPALDRSLGQAAEKAFGVGEADSPCSSVFATIARTP
jgi:hypothetical protein